jgi:hypothetical protein
MNPVHDFIVACSSTYYRYPLPCRHLGPLASVDAIRRNPPPSESLVYIAYLVLNEILVVCPTRCVGRHLNKQLGAALVPWSNQWRVPRLRLRNLGQLGQVRCKMTYFLPNPLRRAHLLQFQLTESVLLSFFTKDYIESAVSSVAPSTLIRLTSLSRRRNTAPLSNLVTQSNDLSNTY